MTTIVSMCSAEHSDVWKLTSQLLPVNLKADRYIVYVPDTEVKIFEQITDPRIEVHAQEPLGKDFLDMFTRYLLDANNMKRFGWYLQQFYKISALKIVEDDIVVIWDADCVPVQPIEIVDFEKRIVFVKSSTELHAPYFENIASLLGMKRIQDFSFVIPSFPIKKKWMNDFIEFIEKKHQKKWFEAIMLTTDFSLQSGFSETETMGTFIANKFPEGWNTRKGTWERFGTSRFGSPKKINVEQLVSIGKKENLEIITFENWDTGLVRKIRTRIFKRRLKRQ